MTRPPVDLARLTAFLERLGRGSRSGGSVYLVGGGCAILSGWRPTSVDIDLKLDPEPVGAFELIRRLKDELSINVELASPDLFIPPVPGWRERSVFIARHGEVDFYHFDFYSQALAKLERGSARDLQDVQAMLESGRVELLQLERAFESIRLELVRYPGLDERVFEAKVRVFMDAHRGASNGD